MRASLLVRLAVSVVFFVSGAAALVYEILWSRQFVTIFGNSAYAISIVLCAFMAGLGAGSLFFGRRADRTADPLRMYALLELGIGATALAIPWLLDLLRASAPPLLVALPTGLASATAVRLVCSFAVLILPCSLIGGTLPVLARFCVEAEGVVGQRVGWLYGLNTLGGAAGCFFAGYRLIETLGVARTGHLAVAANVAIALIALAVRRWRRPPPAQAPAGAPPSLSSRSAPLATRSLAGSLLLVAFLSGFTTLAAEVLWTRLLSLVCQASPYTFTAILSVFLLGLALGSLLYRVFLAGVRDRLAVLGAVQLAIGAAVLGTLLGASGYLVHAGPDAQQAILDRIFAATPAAGQDGGVLAAHFEGRRQVLWSLLAAVSYVLLPTLAMGIVFPLVCAAYNRSLGAVGRRIGLVYAANTGGCIAGSLAPVFLLVPALGIQASLTALALLNAGVGALFLARPLQGAAPPAGGRRRAAAAGVLVLLLAAALAAPRDLGRRIFLAGVPSVGPQSEIVHYEEGRTGTAIVVRDRIDGLYDLFVNSVIEVPTTYLAQGIFRLMGHLGPLLHPDPREALVICFGGGIAGGALNLHPAVQRIDIVDIEGSVIDAARVLEKENNRLHASEKIAIHVEDGRNFLLTCGRRYPLILSDSTHPKTADSWVLYTREYYELVDAALEEPGLFLQWLPYHGISEQEFGIIVRTMQSVLPATSLWLVYGYDERGTIWGYTLLVAMKPRLSLDVELLARRLAEPAVRADLAPFQMETPVKVLRHFAGGPEALRRWTEGLPIDTDDKPWTQYHSRYSAGQPGIRPGFHMMFIPLLESPWPYLVRPEAAGGTALQEELALARRAQELALRGRWADARALLPTDEKLGRMESIIRQGQIWQEAKRRVYPSR
ncbi:MAG: fused MFS/spermidine synthase [Planctomycetota bacterium]